MVASDVPSYFCLHGLYQHVITEKASNVSIYEHEKIGKCIVWSHLQKKYELKYV